MERVSTMGVLVWETNERAIESFEISEISECIQQSEAKQERERSY